MSSVWTRFCNLPEPRTCAQVVAGFLRFGFVSVYLSEAMLHGFTTGAACHVATSQVGYVLGYSVPSYSGAFKLFKVRHSRAS